MTELLNNFTSEDSKMWLELNRQKILKKYNIKKNIDININYFSYNFSKKMRSIKI